MENKLKNIYDRKRNCTEYIVIFMCLAFLFPMICAIIKYNFVRITNGYILCFLCYFCTGITFFRYIKKDYFIDTNTLFLIVFLFVYGLVVICTDDYTLSYNLIFLIPIMLFSHISIEITDKRFILFYIILSIVLFTITMIMTIDTLILYPGASRVLASKAFTEYGYDIYVKRGTGGFDFIYAVTVLIPGGIYVSMHARKLMRIIAISLTAIAMLLIMMSGYATAILLTICGFTLSICIINKWTRRIAIVLIPVVIWFYLSHRMEIAEYINEISKQFSSRAVTEHMKEIANIIAQKSSVDNLDRVEHYKKSLEAFVLHPFIGSYVFTGPSSVSGHSTVLDLLGGGGLLCIVPYIGYCASWYRKIYRRFTKQNSKLFWTIISFAFWGLLFLNPIFASPLIYLAYFSLASILLLSFDLPIEENKKKENRHESCKYIK